MRAPTRRGWPNGLAIVVLAFGGLYYLQFGAQALFHDVIQGALALAGGAGLATGVVRRVRGRVASPVVLATTAPLAAYHLFLTIEDPGELIFFLGSLPVPVIAALVVAVGRVRRPDTLAPAAGT